MMGISVASAQTAPGAQSASSEGAPTGPIATSATDKKNDALVASDQSDAAAKAGLQEIVVTAQKRSESLQKVPVAVSAYSGDALTRRQVVDLADLSRIAPGIFVGNQYGTNRLFIRGIGLTSIAVGADPSSAFHVDGVYVGRPSEQSSSFFDVERVEVVRGPQGTLYGRNATGGSVNVITNKPTTTLSGYANLGYGNYNRIQAEGAVSGPLTSDDSLLARVAIQVINRDGYGKNYYKPDPKNNQPAQDIDDENRVSLRAALEYRASDALRFSLIGEYSRERDHDYANHGFGAYPGYTLEGVLDGYQAITNSRDIISSASEANRRTGYALTGLVNFDLSDHWKFRSISGYRKWNRFNDPDIESTSAPVHGAYYHETSEQESQEFQLNYESQKLKGIVGLFYYHEKVGNDTYLDFSPQNFCTQAAPCYFPNVTYRELGTSDVDAYAAFSQVSYAIFPTVRLTGGIRYSDERRTNVGSYQAPLAPLVPLNQAKSWHSVTPKAGIDVDLAKGVLLYGSYTKGFKSGTFNIGQDNPPIDPEHVDAYEAGLKFTGLDRRLELNLAAFLYNYTNLQVNKVIAIRTLTVNAASAKDKGIEASGRFQVNNNLTINGDVTYVDAKFQDFKSTNPIFPSAGEQDLRDYRLPGSYKLGINLGGEQRFDLSPGQISVRLDASYRSKVYFTEFNQDALSQKGVVKEDASIRYTTENGLWSATLWVKNLSNKMVASAKTLSIQLWGYPITGAYEPPRTFGITLGAKIR